MRHQYHVVRFLRISARGVIDHILSVDTLKNVMYQVHYCTLIGSVLNFKQR